jgi:AcrR family transcriptional regulator
MGRSKTISDSALLDRLLATLKETGPAGLSFSRAARASGLAAATLVQRFGSRDSMVEAVLMHAWDRLDSATTSADAQMPINAEGAVELLMHLMPAASASYDITQGLFLLQEDMRNPALRARGCAWGAYLSRALGRRLTGDIAIAERLGWQMASVWQGALIWWGFTRDTTAEIRPEAMLADWCANLLLPKS